MRKSICPSGEVPKSGSPQANLGMMGFVILDPEIGDAWIESDLSVPIKQ